MPSCVTNGQVTFQSAMKKALTGLNRKQCTYDGYLIRLIKLYVGLQYINSFDKRLLELN